MVLTTVARSPEKEEPAASGSGVVVLLAPVVLVLGEGNDGALHVTARSMEISESTYASWDDTDARTELVLAPASFGLG